MNFQLVELKVGKLFLTGIALYAEIFKRNKNYITIVNINFNKGDSMDFNLKYKKLNETRPLEENYTIKNLLDDLELSSQTTVAKQNGELTIEESVINDGDEIQLVQIIYGG